MPVQDSNLGLIFLADLFSPFSVVHDFVQRSVRLVLTQGRLELEAFRPFALGQGRISNVLNHYTNRTSDRNC